MRPTDPGRSSQLLSREDNAATTVPSFRVYYSLAPRTVPFMWESQPGTPKEAILEEPAIPPLTPPPSYISKSQLRTGGEGKPNATRAGLLHTILRRRFIPSRKDQQGRQPHLVSPAHSGPLSSSSTSSSSTSSSSVGPPMRPTFFFEEEQEAQSKLRQASRSPTICLPVGSPCRTTTAASRWYKVLFSKKLGSRDDA